MDRECGKIQKENKTVPKTKNYEEEYKREVLAYQASTGQTTKQVARHFGVSPSSLKQWQSRAQVPPGAPQPGVATESPEAELRRLRRENRELQMRCEILKKTVVIFGNPPPSATPRFTK